jgi:general secretion pathway protein M
MINMQKIEAYLARFPLAAMVLYVVLVAIFAFMTGDAVLGILQSRAEVAAAAGTLQNLESGVLARPAVARSDVTVPAGSPFLEGSTVSVAGATLMQRVIVAVRRVNGSTLSSQVDLQGPLAKSGFVSASFNLEMAATSLQPFLYDLEAGMPFLFVDDLVIQSSSVASESGKLRVVLGVSARRQSAN